MQLQARGRLVSCSLAGVRLVSVLFSCYRGFVLGTAAIGVVLTGSFAASAMSLQDAINRALDSNPEIGAAISNRQALDFELRQAEGLFLPSVDFEGRSGAQNRDSPTTRAAGTRDDTLFRNEANLIVSQLLFDGWESRGEVERQAARVDGAASRILERSEFIGLNVTRQFLEVARLYRIVQAAQRNISYHKRILANIRTGTSAGAVTEADLKQAEERVFAAEARLVEFQEELNLAGIRFRQLVGEPIGTTGRLPSIVRAIPSSLSEALGIARSSNPTLQIATAAIDEATALVKKAESAYYPKITAEVTGRQGDDLDGIRGRETDLRAEVVMKWNLYRGGIDSANKQEQIRRVDEERYRLHKAHRDVEEAVRLSWETRKQQSRRLKQLQSQLSRANVLVTDYEEQFKIGQRSLLDLLDTQNTKFNTQVAVETAETAYTFAGFRLIASMGTFLSTLGLDAPHAAAGHARQAVAAPQTPPAETQKRWDTEVIGISNWQTRVIRAD